jgi:hypothetical protein
MCATCPHSTGAQERLLPTMARTLITTATSADLCAHTPDELLLGSSNSLLYRELCHLRLATASTSHEHSVSYSTWIYLKNLATIAQLVYRQQHQRQVVQQSALVQLRIQECVLLFCYKEQLISGFGGSKRTLHKGSCLQLSLAIVTCCAPMTTGRTTSRCHRVAFC